MKVAFFSDAHGNSLGLQKCINHAIDQGVQSFFFLGDSVGYFPDINDTIDILRTHQVRCILGNHDAMLLDLISINEKKEKIYRIREARSKISIKNYEFVLGWRQKINLDLESNKILCVHGSPEDLLEGRIYENTDVDYMSGYPLDYLFVGHTHRPFVKKLDNLTLVNVGSCGAPRDQGNLLSYVVFDIADKNITIFRIEFSEEEFSLYKNRIHPELKKLYTRQMDSEVSSVSSFKI